MPRVYIVTPNNYISDVHRMYRQRGFVTTTSIKKADIVQFVGGEDVSPFLYGEEKHRETFNNVKRDKKEAEIYHIALKAGIPMVGICRGGQFLNVMNSGKMYQHVGNHASGNHDLVDCFSGEVHEVTSTHHQMIRPAVDGLLVAYADLGGFKQYMEEDDTVDVWDPEEVDAEVVWYPKSKCLCFQPHPEWNHFSTQQYFFNLLKRFIFTQENMDDVPF